MRLRCVPAAVVTGTVLLVTSGCLPGDPNWAYGAARIGDDYQIFVPLCAGERVVRVDVYDNVARYHGASISPTDTSYTWWKAENPKDPNFSGALMVIGDDSPFKTVDVEMDQGRPFPEIFGVELLIDHSSGGVQQLAEAYDSRQVPSYPAGTDPSTVPFLWRTENGPVEQVTTAEIAKRTGCAAEYPF